MCREFSGRINTFVDILGTLNSGVQQATQGDTTITGTSIIAEVDETSTMSDTVTGTVTTNLGWDQTTWGLVTWS